MLSIIKSDLYRILKGKAIYIVILIMLLLNIISAVGMSPGNIGISMGTTGGAIDSETLAEISSAKSLGEFREIMKNQRTFELDKEVIGQNVNLYYMFIVIVVCVLCTDFSNKCIKNTLSSAISKRKYYLSKLLLTLGICILIVLFNNYSFYFLNLLINGKEFASSLLDIGKYTIVQLPLLCGIISMLVCFAFLFKKTSAFNTISIPFIMVVQLIGLGIINLLHITADWFYNYEIQYALTNLVNNPATSYLIKCTLLGVFYIILFNVVGYYSFKKADIN